MINCYLQSFLSSLLCFFLGTLIIVSHCRGKEEWLEIVGMQHSSVLSHSLPLQSIAYSLKPALWLAVVSSFSANRNRPRLQEIFRWLHHSACLAPGTDVQRADWTEQSPGSERGAGQENNTEWQPAGAYPVPIPGKPNARPSSVVSSFLVGNHLFAFKSNPRPTLHCCYPSSLLPGSPPSR